MLHGGGIINFIIYLGINLFFFGYGIFRMLPTIKRKLDEIDGIYTPDYLMPNKRREIMNVLFCIFLVICGIFFIPHTLDQYGVTRNNAGVDYFSKDREKETEEDLLKAESNIKKSISVFEFTGNDENSNLSLINLGLIYCELWNRTNDDLYFTLAEESFNKAYMYDETNSAPYSNISMLYVAKSTREDDFLPYLDEAYKNAFYALAVDEKSSNANFAMGNFNRIMWFHYPHHENYFDDARTYVRKSYQINMSTGSDARKIVLDTFYSRFLGGSSDTTTPLENSAYPFVFNADDYTRMFYSTPVGELHKKNKESGAQSKTLDKFFNLEDLYDKFIYPSQLQKSRWNLR